MSPSQILRLKLILMQLNYMCRERWSSGKKIPTLIHCSRKTQTAIFDVDIEVLMKTYNPQPHPPKTFLSSYLFAIL